jgi:hypothetical protein
MIYYFFFAARDLAFGRRLDLAGLGTFASWMGFFGTASGGMILPR